MNSAKTIVQAFLIGLLVLTALGAVGLVSQALRGPAVKPLAHVTVHETPSLEVEAPSDFGVPVESLPPAPTTRTRDVSSHAARPIAPVHGYPKAPVEACPF
jgi:hypothetical protein